MNEPAFPAMHYDLAENEHGLTMRDYFAATAIQGLLSDGVGSLSDEELANWAYKLADAMMKVREE